MSDSRHTNFVTQAALMGLCTSSGVVTTDLNALQMEELLRTASAAGCKIKFSKPVDPLFDEFVLAPFAAAVDTNSILIRAEAPGSQVAVKGGVALKSITVTQGSDVMAASNSSGDITITMANSTGSNNTLTKVKVALDALSLQGGTSPVFSTSIKGTASTQFATSAEAAAKTVPGGTVHGCILSTQVGVAASPAVAAGVMTIVTA